MSDMQSWSIGADESCDIVIDKPTVSSEHCRLLWDNQKFVLEDLASTNGVYVNGKKIDSPTVVSPADHITLGSKIRLTLPNVGWVEPVADPYEKTVLANTASRNITIGRGEKNDIVIDESQISSNHAMLLIEGGRITLRDLNSSNGTFHGETKKPVQDAIVSPSDTVFFASHRFSIAELLQKVNIVISEEELSAEPVASDNEHQSVPSLSVVQLSVVGLLIVVVCAVLYGIFRVPHTNVSPSKNQISSTNTSQPQVADSNDVFTDINSQPANAANVNSVNKGLVTNPEDAIYALVVANKDRSQYFQAGTAFAIGPHTLLTSGTCLTRMQLVKNEYPDMFLYKKNMQPVISATAIPQYLEEASQQQELADKLNQVVEQYELVEDSTETESQLETAYKNFLLVSQKIHHVNLAVLKTEASLPSWLALTKVSTNLPPQTRVSIVGAGFDLSAPLLQANGTLAILTEKTRILSITTQLKTEISPGVLTATLDSGRAADHLEIDLTGSPVLNKDKQVIAIYSRRTPSASIFDAPTGESCDATLVYPHNDFINDQLENK